MSASPGSITTKSATGHYIQLGRIIFFYARANVTTNGTGSGALKLGLPFPAVRGLGYGEEMGKLGRVFSVEILASGSSAAVRTYDNLYPAVQGSIIDISGGL